MAKISIPLSFISVSFLATQILYCSAVDLRSHVLHANAIELHHHLSRRAIDVDYSQTVPSCPDDSNPKCNTVKTDKRLQCRSCWTMDGLEGCTPIGTQSPGNSSICLDITVKLESLGSEVEAHYYLGAEADSIFDQVAVDGECNSEPSLIPFLSRFVGRFISIKKLEVCACSTDFCNKPQTLPKKPQVIEQSVDDGVLKCEDCMSVDGVAGCIQTSKTRTAPSSIPEMCVTMTTKLRSGDVDVTIVSRQGVTADAVEAIGFKMSDIDGKCKNVSPGYKALLERLSSRRTSDRTMIDNIQVCGCTTNYCNRAEK